VHLKTELENLSQDKENVKQVLTKEKKQLERKRTKPHRFFLGKDPKYRVGSVANSTMGIAM
jgi:hypothetical protein